MAEPSYLIAFALLEQKGSRSMPLGGKSLKESIRDDNDLAGLGKGILLELLVRLFQRSNSDSLSSAAGDRSLLLVEMPMGAMQEQLPIMKADWLNTGDTDKFLLKLQEASKKIWWVGFEKYQGISFESF